MKKSCEQWLRKDLVSMITGIVLLLSSTMSFAANMPLQGTIQSLQQDGGIIRISGRDLNYRDDSVTITLGDTEISAENLSEGMIVRYTVSAAGFLETIVVIGPRTVVGEVDNS